MSGDAAGARGTCSAFLRKPCLPQYLLHELRQFLPA